MLGFRTQCQLPHDRYVCFIQCSSSSSLGTIRVHNGNSSLSLLRPTTQGRWWWTPSRNQTETMLMILCLLGSMLAVRSVFPWPLLFRKSDNTWLSPQPTLTLSLKTGLPWPFAMAMLSFAVECIRTLPLSEHIILLLSALTHSLVSPPIVYGRYSHVKMFENKWPVIKKWI